MNPHTLEAVHFYRPLGFFEDAVDLSDEELAATLEARYAEAMGPVAGPLVGPEPKQARPGDWENAIPAEAHPEVNLLALDPSRVWWQDLEMEYLRDDGQFVRLIEAWANISRGAFNPTGVREIWPEGEPMYIEFEWDGDIHRITPWAEEDQPDHDGFGWTDLEILNGLNELLGPTGYAYHLHDPFDQTGFVVVLTEEEAEILQNERGWVFVGEWEEE